MAFNINKFRSSFINGEPASPTNYEVEIFRKQNQVVIDVSTGERKLVDLFVERLMKYRCITCSLPGKMLTTVERNTYGPSRKIATSALYQDVVFSFMIGDDVSELDYFHSWMGLISNNVEVVGATVNDVAYYDTYVSDTFITQYNKSGEITRKIKLEESYPINIEAIPMGWEMNNEIMKVDVTLAYRNWHTIKF
jgi:hypothetical protein